MFAVFQKYLQDKASFTDQEMELITSVSKIKKLRKRHYLLQEGDIWKFNAFVCKGFLRTYFVDDKGGEHIMNFAPENYWTGDRESLTNGSPSKYNIDALEDSEVLLINKVDFDMLCKAIPVFNDLINTILHNSFLASQQRIHSNITSSAEEKYNNFITRQSHIANRIPLHMIASYLGISAETVSRIRTQATKK
ncbi:Crp/Fnr family transcriptional regulator [Flavobacterium sp. N1736]|uniref:Crp/Fnr family transcriptional regulator n=1 Tax=Flavobacterium sp. N1736 TaxID=2986823 RepID=UPI002225A1DC|nr:Crp/Fnr family transcriptional regulator [Flavobacterium sp. N1736]